MAVPYFRYCHIRCVLTGKDISNQRHGGDTRHVIPPERGCLVIVVYIIVVVRWIRLVNKAPAVAAILYGWQVLLPLPLFIICGFAKGAGFRGG